MKLKITAKDIAEGERGRCERCPVALALARRLKTKVVVTAATADWLPKGRAWRIVDLSAAAKRFIRDFDNGLRVRPRTIELF